MKLGCGLVAGLFCVFLAGCVGVENSGSEHVLSRGSKYAVTDKSFSYRQLRIEDFQAEALDRGIGSSIHHVQARSCVSIQTAADMRIRVTETKAKEKRYTGMLSNISYQAIFEPYCSWWNPSIVKDRVPYVLEHEQIHFALTELSARRLNKKIQKSFTPETVHGQTAQEVEGKLREKVRAASKSAIALSSVDQRAFDEQTSYVYRPQEQLKWLKDVNRKLAETEAYK